MRRERPETLAGLRLLGGRLCLDFANTVDPRDGPEPLEYLRTVDDVLTWAARVGLVTEDGARRLSEAQPVGANATTRLARWIELREAIFRTFRAHARDEEPDPADVALVAQAYAEGLARARLVETGDRYEWRGGDTSLDDLLWPVAASAVELLTSPLLARVRECAAAGDCGWLFLDTTKNGTRRWCRMAGCGSRAKARRSYARRRAGRVPSAGSARR